MSSHVIPSSDIPSSVKCPKHEFAGSSSADPSSSQCWRPKFTPYRALVLSSTIGLGSAKAYATSRDSALAAPTIEWIVGVALLSIFFILGKLESNPPRSLYCLFGHDLNRPSHYFPDEKVDAVSTSIDIHTRVPPITGYRLLTSVSISSFGFVKAYIAYQGASQAANAVDWIAGTLLVSCLYVLGLYKDNPVGLLPYLFSFDYTPPLLTACWIILYLFGLLLCCVWTRYWLRCLFIPFPDIRAIYNGTDKVVDFLINPAPTTTFQGIQNLSQFTYHILGGLLISSIGAIFFVLISIGFSGHPAGIKALGWVKPIYEAVSTGLTAISRVRAQTTRLLPWIKKPFRMFRRLLIFFRRFTLHILVYTFSALMTGTLAFNNMGSFLIVWSIASENLLTLFVAIYFTVMAGIPLCILCYVCVCCLRFLVAPFRVDWEASGYTRTLFELGG